MQNVIHVLHGLLAGGRIADIALDEREVPPLFGAHRFLDFVQVVLMAGCEVVQTDDRLVQLQQGFQQIGADEAGAAGDQPALGLGAQFDQDFLIAIAHVY